jgi:malate dehydrogenase
MKNIKIGLVGGGNIGGTIAHLALEKNCYEVALIDINEDLVKGKALDLKHAMTIKGLESKIIAGGDYNLLEGSDVVIVTAGIPRRPGMSRDDLLSINGGIISQVASNIKKKCPHAFVIVITNPLDVMVGMMQEESGLPCKKVVGMAGVLDTGRYKSFLAELLKVSVTDIQGFVLGGHGDTMVPVPRFTKVCGIPLEDFMKMNKIDMKVLNSIIERTRNGGAEIVALLKNGSAYYAPAVAALEMAESYLYDQKKILPCAAYLNGEYGVTGEYVGVPVVIGKNGVEKVLELDLDEQEKQEFLRSLEAVKNLKKNLKEINN